MANLNVAIAAPGHLLHNCFILCVLSQPILCDSTCFPGKPAITLLRRSIRDHIFRHVTHKPCLIVSAEMVARLRKSIVYKNEMSDV